MIDPVVVGTIENASNTFIVTHSWRICPKCNRIS